MTFKCYVLRKSSVALDVFFEKNLGTTLVVYRPKGLTVFLAQPKELKVPQGWVDHCQMIPRANGLTVRRTSVTNGQTLGPLARERGRNPALRIFDS